MNKIGLLGFPIKHSISDYIHNLWIKQLNIKDFIYKKVEISEIELNRKKIENLLLEGYIGFNVTLPYKEKIIDLLDETTVNVKKIKACNFIYTKNNKLIGDNSDYIGFINGLKKEYPKFKIENSRVLILGAGGASRAVIYTLLENMVSEIIIVNRTITKANKIKKDFSNEIIRVSSNFYNIKNIDLVVNCTNLGMKGEFINENPFDFNEVKILNKDAIFYDLVYNPINTFFLKKANELGFRVINGLPMLIYQAHYCFKKWFNLEPIINSNFYNIIGNQIK